MDLTQAAVAVIVALFGGGALATLATTFFRPKSDTAKVIVDAAGGVVLVQTGVITSLREGLKRCQDEIDELHQELAEARKMRNQIYELQKELQRTLNERDGLQRRVSMLESEVEVLRIKLKAHEAKG